MNKHSMLMCLLFLCIGSFSQNRSSICLGKAVVTENGPNRTSSSNAEPDAVLEHLLTKEHEINGTVRDSKGKPVPNARIILSSISENSAKEFLAQSDGAFSITYTAEDAEHRGYPFYLFAWSPDDTLASFIGVNESLSSQDITLLPSATLSGHVFNYHGERPSGVKIYTWFPTKEGCVRLGRSQVQTGALGQYTITGIPQGYKYRIKAESAEHGLGEIDANLTYTKRVHIELDTPIILRPKSSSISGIVLDPKGNPVPEALLLVRRQLLLTRTNSEGEFVIENILLDGPVFIEVHAIVMNKKMTGYSTVEVSRNDLKILVKPNNPIPESISVISTTQESRDNDFVITGYTREKGKTPIEGVRLTILPTSIIADQEVYFSNSNGQFQINCRTDIWPKEISTDPYLIARHPKRNLAAMLPIRKDTREVEVTLTEGTVVVGRVVDDEGNPISEATILLRFHMRNFNDSIPLSLNKLSVTSGLKTLINGEFEIKAIPNGHKYIIAAEDEAFRSGKSVIDLRNTTSTVSKNITIIIKP